MAGFHDEEDKELVRNLWRQMRLLPPSSARHRRWTSLLVLLYFINLMLMPIDVCFYHLHVRDPPGVPFYLISDPIDYAIDGIFMIDLFLTFQMTYRIEETNELVTERRLIAKRYLRGWATFDFLISVPWSVIEPLSPVIRWLKVMKLLRYARVFRLSGRDNGKALHLKRVLSVLMYFMIGAHWVASVWWFIGAIETDTALFELADVDGTGSISQLEFALSTPNTTTAVLHSCGCSTAIAALPFDRADENLDGELSFYELGRTMARNCPVHCLLSQGYAESWMQRIPKVKWNGNNAYAIHKHSPFEQQYLSSLYWSFTALVKVPWIAPNTTAEKVYSSLVIIAGAVFFAWLLGSIVAAISAVERTNAQRREKMALMHTFSATRRLSPSLKSGMTHYVDAMFSFNNDVEGTERLGTLPASMRISLLEVVHKDLLRECELLRSPVSKSTALAVCQHLQPQVCLAKSRLVERHAVATHLFLLHRGNLHVRLASEDEDARRRSLTDKGPHLKGKHQMRIRVCERMGSFMGIYDPFDFTTRLPFEVVAVKVSQLFAIERHQLIDVLEHVGPEQSAIILEALQKEQGMVLEALKHNRPARPQQEAPAPLPPGGGRRRRSSITNIAVGTLLQEGAMPTPEEIEAETHKAWDEAVEEVTDSMRTFESTAHAYKREVKGFVKGLGSTEQLLAALQLVPDHERPKLADSQPDSAPQTAIPSSSAAAPSTIHAGHKGNAQKSGATDAAGGSGADGGSPSAGKGALSGLHVVDENGPGARGPTGSEESYQPKATVQVSPQGHRAGNGRPAVATAADAGGGEPPNSGIRIINSLTKMGQEMLSALQPASDRGTSSSPQAGVNQANLPASARPSSSFTHGSDMKGAGGGGGGGARRSGGSSAAGGVTGDAGRKSQVETSKPSLLDDPTGGKLTA